MRTTTTICWAAAACLSLARLAAAEILQGRQNGQESASSTAFPTVPSFSRNSFTYGYFTKVYPTGYTGPSGAVDTATMTKTASATASSHAGGYGYPYNPAERSQLRYLESMCNPPTINTGSPLSLHLDLSFPCNELRNITNMCLYKSPGSSLQQQDSQAQQRCLCPGGPGATIWETIGQ